MEYPCHQCHATVQEGMAFCPQCDAPQIRVAVAEALTSSGIRSDVPVPPLAPYFRVPLASRIDWGLALPTTALAGLLAAVLMLTPLRGFGLGMLIGGGLSVVFYRRRNPVANITLGMGARLGMASGLLGGAMFALLLLVGTVMLHSWDRQRQTLIELVEQMAARNPDPQAQQAIEFFKTPDGLVVLLASAMAVTLVGFVLFSGLGGALGAVLLRRKERL